MTREEKIERLRNCTEAYILFSNATKLPFVVCEKENYFDQIFLYENQEEAEAAAKSMSEGGDAVGVAPLKTVEFSEEQKASFGDSVKGKMRNQVREHLMRIPQMGIGAVYYKVAGEEGVLLEVKDILPEAVMQYVESGKNGLETVRLTALYFAQYLRRQDRDVETLKEYAEEFEANLVNSTLLVVVIPSEDQMEATQLDMSKCQLVSYGLKRADNGETQQFLAIFTNMDEAALMSARTGQKTKVIQVPFEELPRLLGEVTQGVVLDPFSFCLPLRKEDIPNLVRDFKKEK